MNKRKVSWEEEMYTEKDFEYYEKKGEIIEQKYERMTGFLHFWGQSAYMNEEFGVMLTDTYCYVEKEKTGEIVRLHPENVTFIKEKK